MFAALSSQLMRQADEVVAPQHHRRVAVDRLERHRLLVLAGDGEQRCPAACSALQRPLEVDERLADGVVPAEAQLLPAVVADDAAPQRVVEIDDDELAGRRRARRRSAAAISSAATANTRSSNGILPR